MLQFNGTVKNFIEKTNLGKTNIEIDLKKNKNDWYLLPESSSINILKGTVKITRGQVSFIYFKGMTIDGIEIIAEDSDSLTLNVKKETIIQVRGEFQTHKTNGSKIYVKKGATLSIYICKNIAEQNKTCFKFDQNLLDKNLDDCWVVFTI